MWSSFSREVWMFKDEIGADESGALQRPSGKLLIGRPGLLFSDRGRRMNIVRGNGSWR